MGEIRTFGRIDKKAGKAYVEILQPILVTKRIFIRLLPACLLILPNDKLPMLIG